MDTQRERRDRCVSHQDEWKANPVKCAQAGNCSYVLILFYKEVRSRCKLWNTGSSSEISCPFPVCVSVSSANICVITSWERVSFSSTRTNKPSTIFSRMIGLVPDQVFMLDDYPTKLKTEHREEIRQAERKDEYCQIKVPVSL